jgi:hypothetical protein
MHGRMFNRAHYILAPVKLLRLAHDDVFGNMEIMQCCPDLKLPGSLRTFHGHYDEQVHVAVRPRFAASVGTEEYYLVRIKLRCYAPSHVPDLSLHWYLGLGHIIPPRFGFR